MTPENLNTPEFLKAWADWYAYRRDRRLSKYTDLGAKRQLTMLSRFGPSVAIEAISQAMDANWQGLFPNRVLMDQAAAVAKPKGDGKRKAGWL